VSCVAGTADCDGDGNCEDTTSSTQHCGGCDTPCEANQTCVSSVCTDSVECPPCSGDLVCDESSGFCRCPAAKPVVCLQRNGYCSANLSTDPERCGQFCETCAAGGNCCNGSCVYGCGPGVNPASSSCGTEPCGGGCEVCTDGKYCCNLGPGTASKCVLPSGGQCPPA